MSVLLEARTNYKRVTGHVFGGPSLPYAMVKPVADAFDNNRGGFSWDGNMITGYSHMHDTGIGGVSVGIRRRWSAHIN